MNGIRLTICVLAYNVEAYLAETLASVVMEDLAGQYEVIVVDDGSTDGTGRIAQGFADRYPAIFRVISKENGGMGSGFNVGMQNARGRYFKQLDGDDMLETDHLRELMAYLGEDGTDLVLAPSYSFDDRTGEVADRRDYPGIAEHARERDFDKIAEYYPWLEMHAACVRTDILRQNRITLREHCFYVDVEYMVKACSHVRTVSFYPAYVYRYRVFRKGQSMSMEGLRKHYGEHAKVCLELAAYVRDLDCPERTARVLTQRTAFMISWQYSLYLRMPPSRKIRRSLAQFDRTLKRVNPGLYEGTKSKRMRVIRATGYLAYPLVAAVLQKREEKAGR